MEEHFEELPYVDYLYFEKFGKNDLRRAKYAKGDKQGESTRIIRSSEITVMMYAAGIPTLPSQKESVVQDKTLTDNVYYQSREIKYYSGFKDKLDENEEAKRTLINSRINGTLLSAGGNYNVYHIGKSLQIWNASGEYNLKRYIENMLAAYINQNSCKIQNAILVAYDLTIFADLIEPTKSLNMKFGALSATFDHIYILPFDKSGRDMLNVMTCMDWENIIKELVTETKISAESNLEYACDFYDKTEKAYVFVFCVPDITRYIRFLRKVIFDISAGKKKKDDFIIYCFDYQLDLVKKTAFHYAQIRCGSFDEFISDEWKQVQENLEYYQKGQ